MSGIRPESRIPGPEALLHNIGAYTPVRAGFRPSSVLLEASDAQPVYMSEFRHPGLEFTPTPVGPQKPPGLPSQAENQPGLVDWCRLPQDRESAKEASFQDFGVKQAPGMKHPG